MTSTKTTLTTCDLSEMADGRRLLLLTTLAGKKGCCVFYTVERIDCADLAWELRKCTGETGSDPEAESYAVNLTMNTCECRGHLRHGKCKHFSAILRLHEERRIA